MEPSLYRTIWKYSAQSQILVLCITLAAFPLLYASLELPKIIIDFLESNATSVPVTQLFRLELPSIAYLLTLCAVLTFLLLAVGVCKMRINTLKGIIGERMVRRLRHMLLERMLYMREEKFDTLSQGELVSTITAETEPLAGFIGDSIALPVFQGGTLLTILVFMFAQDPYLGAASIISIPIQAIIIPRLQKRINRLGKERVLMVRRLSERIGEAAVGYRTIRVHGTFRYTMAEFSKYLGDIFKIRFEIFQRKFMMKFINNMIGYLTPVLFYSLGGVLVLQGDISIGALVASLVAYKDLAAPWKELLNYYQRAQDSIIKYEQIQDNFGDAHLIERAADPALRGKSLHADIQLQGVSHTTNLGSKSLRDVTVTFEAGKTTAITGMHNLDLRRLAEILVGVTKPTRGKIYIGDIDLCALPADWKGKKLAYVGPEPFMFAGTIMQNLMYG
ncbi:MAG: ABC transporter ATP-binding protein, partial [Pseudomonadota bacterium]